VKFLIVDDSPDNRYLVSRTLLRKFPAAAAAVECQTFAAAAKLLNSTAVDLIIAHRTPEFRGVALIQQLRTLCPTVPIIALSSMNQREAALAAGADRFYLTDEWLLIGAAAVELLAPETVRQDRVEPADQPST